MKKIILGILVILLIVYALFVAIDCIRLRNSTSGTKPIITISLGETENGNIYKGLGYSIEYYVSYNETVGPDGNKIIEKQGYGAEFRLFNKILIWAWVE